MPIRHVSWMFAIFLVIARFSFVWAGPISTEPRPFSFLEVRSAETTIRSRGEEQPVLSWETGEGKSYVVPALEVVAFNLGLNGFCRLAFPDETENGKKVYSTNFSTFWNNTTHGHWQVDRDSFQTNQFRHGVQGTIYQGSARSAGLTFWESFGYSFAGSLLWKMAGETTTPSINDQVTSGVGGPFLGEPLFRIANLILEAGAGEAWRELAAAILSPPTGFNRFVFGPRFNDVFPSRNPAVFWSLRLGTDFKTHASGPELTGFPNTQEFADFSIIYGMPGKPGYSYIRPFGYFSLSAAVASYNVIQKLTTNGILIGKPYEIGQDHRGIYGLYGSFDYLSPPTFRVSSTAVSFASTAQSRLLPWATLQSEAATGIGYGGGGTVSGKDPDYHQGMIAQGAIDLRLILSDRAMLGLVGRHYYVTGIGSGEVSGYERIGYATAGLTVRICDRHALGIMYTIADRTARVPPQSSTHQRVGIFSLSYTLMSDTRFGALKW